jgi:phosphoribosylamine--glycine ligase
MKVLVIGSGGREHAIIWKLRQSFEIDKIYCTIGNPGINEIAEPVNINSSEIDSLLKFVKDNKIGFTVVGPEIPLAAGIVDEFVSHGSKIFGPSKNAARLENSKVFAKEFMKRHGIPTAKFETFSSDEKDKSLVYLNDINYPVVIKADGLAAGKGVIICDDIESAKKTILEIFESKIFGKSGENIVIEEFLSGNEASVFAICDGENYIVLPPAQDHKKIFDGEKGKNTGGMGSFAPAHNTAGKDTIEKVRSRIIEPVLKYMMEEGN